MEVNHPSKCMVSGAFYFDCYCFSLDPSYEIESKMKTLGASSAWEMLQLLYEKSKVYMNLYCVLSCKTHIGCDVPSLMLLLATSQGML